MVNALDYLARHVHEFEKDRTHITLSRDVYFYSHEPKGIESYTRQQWLDRRAELQNKPSWDKIPEWVEWLAQNSGGRWEWFCGKDRPEAGAVDWVYWNEAIDALSDGEVLGNWKDTLEQRPAAARSPDVMGEEKTLVAEFEPFTSVEDAQSGYELAEMTPETPERAKKELRSLRTIHHAAFLHQDCRLLLSEPELVVFRTADGELIHCKPKECLIDPDVYGLAARLLAHMSGCPIAPEHMRELCEQIGWSV